ncbi:MAG: hypothetical protein QGI81_11060 [Pseudomonadales bacterium]|jgi:hypothetical protein|nr:hypothetical protein [Pseudomonadales bacterium]|tara:strand:+ start:1845 stop:2225 length:381 start_codon:yes stop_codon:yes gene_type:complete
MASLLLIIIVAAAAVMWVRGARQNRLRWLEKLHLPGLWHGDSGVRLELGGTLEGGPYRLLVEGREERGAWSLHGHDLMLHGEGESGPRRYDLRFFDAGKIGLHGQALDREILNRAGDNIVPLRRTH